MLPNTDNYYTTIVSGCDGRKSCSNMHTENPKIPCFYRGEVKLYRADYVAILYQCIEKSGKHLSTVRYPSIT